MTSGDGAVDAVRRQSAADVVGARQQHDHLRIDAIELAVLQPPQDVLDAVGAPAEVRRVPSEEVLLPVLQQLRIVGGAPAPRDGVAFEIDVDARPAWLCREVPRAPSGNSCPCSRDRLVGRNASAPAAARPSPCRPGCILTGVPPDCVCCRNLSAHGMKYFQFGPSVCPPSCCRQASCPSSKRYVHRRHLLGVIVVRHAQVLRAQQPEHRLRGHGGHEAALMIEPLGVALLRHAVADEGQARRAQRDQFVRVDRKVAGVLLPNVASEAPYFRKLPAIQ